MPFVIPSTPGADLEGLVLGGLSLNDATFHLLEFSCPPPKQRQEFVGGSDSEYQALVRGPLHENREITARVGIDQQADMDSAIAKIGQVVDVLQSIEPPDAIDLEWTPAGSTFTGTFEVLAGEITDLPIGWESGYLAQAPSFTIRMVAKPYLLGEEVTGSEVTASFPLMTVTVEGVGGDVPALGTLIATDMASQARRLFEWGAEHDPNGATSLLLDSDSLVTSGFGGSPSGISGAYDPNSSGNNAISATLYTIPASICGTGDQTHVGTYRVVVRAGASLRVAIRLTWQAGDGPLTYNDWATIELTDQWMELDLGEINIPEALSGTQRWTGTLEGYVLSEASAGCNIDYMALVPTGAGYGKARAINRFQPGPISAIDDFNTLGNGAGLHARSAVSGGLWVTSGDTYDFVGASGAITRTTAVAETSGRTAILGSGTYTNTALAVDVSVDKSNSYEAGFIARYIDQNNYVRGFLNVLVGSKGPYVQLTYSLVTAGTVTASAGSDLYSLFGMPVTTWRLRLFAWDTGTLLLSLETLDGAPLLSHRVYRSDLATGGGYASGRVGLYDREIATYGSVLRTYDNFFVQVPPPEPVVINSGRTLQVRHDDTIRQNAAGTIMGRPSLYQGSRFLLKPGDTRIAARARREDTENYATDSVTDSLKLQATWRERFLVVPRG